jgi:hypothetical protein
MRSRRFPRLILVISLAALVTSAYVVSGFSRTNGSDVVSGFSRTNGSDVVSGFSRTSSPSHTPDDAVWEAATHVATTSGSSFRVRTQHIPLASFAHSVAVLPVGNAHTSDLADVVRDRSPQHSLPLLI